MEMKVKFLPSNGAPGQPGLFRVEGIDHGVLVQRVAFNSPTQNIRHYEMGETNLMAPERFAHVFSSECAADRDTLAIFKSPGHRRWHDRARSVYSPAEILVVRVDSHDPDTGAIEGEIVLRVPCKTFAIDAVGTSWAKETK